MNNVAITDPGQLFRNRIAHAVEGAAQRNEDDRIGPYRIGPKDGVVAVYWPTDPNPIVVGPASSIQEWLENDLLKALNKLAGTT